MEFTKWIRRYLRIFHILGQTSFLCPESNQRRQSNYIPIIILLALTFYTSISSFTYQYKYMRAYGLANSFVANCLILTQMTLNLIVITQTIVYRRNLKLILKNFVRIHGILRAQLGQNLPFRKINRGYLLKVGVVFTCFGCALTSMLCLPLSMGDLLVSGHFFILLFFTHVSNVHAILYLDLLKYLLLNFTRNIDNMADAQSRGAHKICVKNTLRCCQSVHLRLWTISQQIGLHFGWSIALTHLQCFFLAVYSAYWLFIFNQKSYSNMSFRKYFKCSFFISTWCCRNCCFLSPFCNFKLIFVSRNGHQYGSHIQRSLVGHIMSTISNQFAFLLKVNKYS